MSHSDPYREIADLTLKVENIYSLLLGVLGLRTTQAIR